MSLDFNGRIELIFGCMFSGKSTELLRKVDRHLRADRKCLLVSYQLDNRYSIEDAIVTHDRYGLNPLS